LKTWHIWLNNVIETYQTTRDSNTPTIAHLTNKYLKMPVVRPWPPCPDKRKRFVICRWCICMPRHRSRPGISLHDLCTSKL